MFRSFVAAGFDCTVGRNRHGERIDHPAQTGHERQLDHDYTLVLRAGFRTIRDGMPWPNVETRRGRYDWSRFDRIVEASKRHGLEVIYDFCHFGYPEHLDIFSDEFVAAFAAYCYAAAQRLLGKGVVAPYITPINEPSYFAWAAGDAAAFHPFRHGASHAIKVQLVRAILAGSAAIHAVLPQAVTVTVDPICRAVPPFERPDLAAEAERFNTGAVREAWDMLAGKLYPELGGTPAALGVLGVNYYWTNQWELGNAGVPLPDDDPRRASLSELVTSVWKRYGVPIVLSETGHIGAARAPWLRELAAQSQTLLRAGVPLGGVCLYPIVGMPSWDVRTDWLAMGLWDVDSNGKRVACQGALEALGDLQTVETGRGARRSLIMTKALE